MLYFYKLLQDLVFLQITTACKYFTTSLSWNTKFIIFMSLGCFWGWSRGPQDTFSWYEKAGWKLVSKSSSTSEDVKEGGQQVFSVIYPIDCQFLRQNFLAINPCFSSFIFSAFFKSFIHLQTSCREIIFHVFYFLIERPFLLWKENKKLIHWDLAFRLLKEVLLEQILNLETILGT